MSCVIGTHIGSHGRPIDVLTDKVWNVVCNHLNDPVEFHCFAELDVTKEGSRHAVRELMHINMSTPSESAISVVFSSDGSPPSVDAMSAVGYDSEQLLDKVCVRESIQRALSRQKPMWLAVELKSQDQADKATYRARGYVILDDVFMQKQHKSVDQDGSAPFGV